MKPETDRTDVHRRFTGSDPQAFTDDAKWILRSVMKRRGFTFKQLAAAMEANGDASFESVQTLINKVSRGRFPSRSSCVPRVLWASFQLTLGPSVAPSPVSKAWCALRVPPRAVVRLEQRCMRALGH